MSTLSFYYNLILVIVIYALNFYIYKNGLLELVLSVMYRNLNDFYYLRYHYLLTFLLYYRSSIQACSLPDGKCYLLLMDIYN